MGKEEQWWRQDGTRVRLTLLVFFSGWALGNGFIY